MATYQELDNLSNDETLQARVRTALRAAATDIIDAWIEDQETIDRILTHLRQKEQELPTRPPLVPPTRAPPGTLPLFAGKGAR